MPTWAEDVMQNGCYVDIEIGNHSTQQPCSTDWIFLLQGVCQNPVHVAAS